MEFWRIQCKADLMGYWTYRCVSWGLINKVLKTKTLAKPTLNSNEHHAWMCLQGSAANMVRLLATVLEPGRDDLEKFSVSVFVIHNTMHIKMFPGFNLSHGREYKCVYIVITDERKVWPYPSFYRFKGVICCCSIGVLLISPDHDTNQTGTSVCE